jgi:DNA-binding IclR family transcriptional regulator
MNRSVRERGYAISDGDHILGALSIAAPIHGTGGDGHRGTHVTMSTAGITDSQHHEFERLVVESADSLSCMMTNGVAAGRS